MELFNRLTLTKVGIYPLLSASITHPKTCELSGRQHIHFIVVFVHELQLSYIPMRCTFHLQQQSEMLRLDRQIKTYHLIQHTCWQIILRLLFVGVGMQLVMKQRARQIVAFPFANCLPIMAIIR